MGLALLHVLYCNDSTKACWLMLSVILQIDFKTKTFSWLEIPKALVAKIRDSRDLKPRLFKCQFGGISLLAVPVILTSNSTS